VTTWDILTTSIPHRHEKLLELLKCLDEQMTYPGTGMILYRDDLEVAYGDKTQALIEASAADYVSCIDDDDLVAPDFVSRVMRALEAGPQYVGFNVRWTRDGVPQKPVIHSLSCGGWHDKPERLERDITQFNPIRRDLALLGKWAGGYEAERRWGNEVRNAQRVGDEDFIGPGEMYYYRECAQDTFKTDRQKLGHMPELPAYPWLRQIGPYA
jgi:hypothetical protein